jgi:hypothetical protein
VKSPRSTQDATIPLSTADIFAWLSEEGHFLRPASVLEIKSEIDQIPKLDKPAEIWCSVCGQDVETHLSISAVKKETADVGWKDDVKAEDAIRQAKDKRIKRAYSRAIPVPCNIAPIELQISKLPMNNIGAAVNLYTHLSQRVDTKSQTRDSITKSRTAKYYRSSVIVSAAHPKLTMAVRNVVMSLKLPTFSPGSLDLFPSEQPFQQPLDALGTHRSRVEKHLAPHAILALATQQFIRVLIEGGVDVVNREKATATGLAGSTARRKGRTENEKDKHISLLTPVHVLSNIITRGQGRSQTYREVDIAIAGCLARLGVSAIDSEDTAIHEDESAMDSDEDVLSVKTEQV